MIIEILKSKIHRVKITQAELHYVGSITIDEALMEAADIIENERIVFNIGGNNYRLICAYWFGPGMVHLYVKWIGTHAEYNRLCDLGLQSSIDNF